MPRPFLVNTKRNPAALVRYGRVRPEPREMVMKKKSLAMLVAALSIGVSSMGLMSATAKDAAIIKKKGAAQTDQSGQTGAVANDLPSGSEFDAQGRGDGQ